MGGRYDLTDFEWSVIQPLLPNKPRGVPRADERRVLNGIFWVLRSGAPWRDLPERYGPYTTCYNRFNRWRKVGVWDRLMDAVTKAYDGEVQMIDRVKILCGVFSQELETNSRVFAKIGKMPAVNLILRQNTP